MQLQSPDEILLGWVEYWGHRPPGSGQKNTDLKKEKQNTRVVKGKCAHTTELDLQGHTSLVGGGVRQTGRSPSFA